ncbi:MAG: CvpA family protein, partial [Candidatus Marinimicrobia bacterium]|nr:CvpA family protein [Candidatus Neomarinimicrobiota bacterium]
MATGFDLIGLLLIVIMAISGLKKGLIDGVLKMVGIYAAIYASMHYNQYGTALIEPLIHLPDAYKVPAGFVIMFILVMYSITFISFILKKLVKTMRLGAVDRLGGITFGALKAGLILSAFVWAFAMVPADRRGTWQKESKLYPVVEVFAGNMVKILSLEDELATLQSMMDPNADKTQL